MDVTLIVIIAVLACIVAAAFLVYRSKARVSIATSTPAHGHAPKSVPPGASGGNGDHPRVVMNKATWMNALFTTLTLVLIVGCATSPTALPSPVTARPTMGKPTGKLSARLEMLANSPDLRTASVDEQGRALSLPPKGPGSLVRDAQGRVLVDIRTADVSAKSLQSLRDAGAAITNVAEAYQQVTAFVALSDLMAIANLSTVLNVQEELAPANSGGVVIPHPP